MYDYEPSSRQGIIRLADLWPHWLIAEEPTTVTDGGATHQLLMHQLQNPGRANDSAAPPRRTERRTRSAAPSAPHREPNSGMAPSVFGSVDGSGGSDGLVGVIGQSVWVGSQASDRSATSVHQVVDQCLGETIHATSPQGSEYLLRRCLG